MASIEKIRVDIRSIFPGNGAELFIYAHGSEVIWGGANFLLEVSRKYKSLF
ncbi:hypothetical protein DSTSK_36940 [Desulforhabdus sp. TSK]|nr:hypothetical protein DSTSK_36940 [Desulforhabdus sp. TSK]